jgi:cupin superfamily acireductone dioxygenase involved in methionine salvage
MLTTTLPTQTEQEHVTEELRHAEVQLQHWRGKAADTKAEPGQRKAAAAQAAWYAQQVDRYRTRLAQLRRAS